MPLYDSSYINTQMQRAVGTIIRKYNKNLQTTYKEDTSSVVDLKKNLLKAKLLNKKRRDKIVCTYVAYFELDR